jgi:6-phospho-beta-glucosidase
VKLAVIGGASVRTPLLVRGLCGSDLPIAEVALYDSDQQRLPVIAALAREYSGATVITPCATLAAAVEGASFVFTSIRVGGIEARARDEAAALARGLVGQETVGPAGFALAMRNIPPLIACAREVERRAPLAWMVNFSNPVGIVTQALRNETSARVIGICDTPIELFERAAHALGLPAEECDFDYFGLNHLGWLREVRHGGAPQLHRLWGDPARLASIHRGPLFEPEALARLRLLPSEYVFYYDRPALAVENMRRAGPSRGEVIRRLNADLSAALAGPGPKRKAYEAYLAARDGGYMQAERGAAPPAPPPPAAGATGYDRIALDLVRAIHGNTGAVLPLSVPNRANVPELEDDDVIEVPCRIDVNGPRPLHVGRVPDSVRGLLAAVKVYERLTARAAVSREPAAVREALAANPLVPSREVAADLVAAMDLR